MKRRHVITALFAVASLCSGTTAAQAPDSLAFHRGQWGAEFNISGGFFSAGALRFTSATHAWLLDLGAGYSHNSFSGPAGSGSGNLTTITAELGSRSNHSIGASALSSDDHRGAVQLRAAVDHRWLYEPDNRCWSIRRPRRHVAGNAPYGNRRPLARDGFVCPWK